MTTAQNFQQDVLRLFAQTIVAGLAFIATSGILAVALDGAARTAVLAAGVGCGAFLVGLGAWARRRGRANLAQFRESERSARGASAGASPGRHPFEQLVPSLRSIGAWAALQLGLALLVASQGYRWFGLAILVFDVFSVVAGLAQRRLLNAFLARRAP